MVNPRKSKIVAKIADNKSEIPFLKSLFEAGADIAWLNTAHQDEPGTLSVIERIREVTTHIPIAIDTKGPEVRTKNIETPLPVKAGDKIIFTGDLTYVGPNVILVSYTNFHKEIPVGTSIFYDDALLEFVVEKKTDRGLECEVKSNGTIKNKKSINVPNVHIKLPALSEKDKGFIHFCARHNVDFITHSFVRGREDIEEIRKILKAYPDYNGKIIAKIENREGFDNLKEILQNCDGIMVARGDLGAEVPLPEMPFMQKKMVEAAIEAGKYCIVATQVLESMIKNPRPTRAEVTDIANSVLDGTSAISMSGETAYGDFPFEATAMMGRVMQHTELVRDDLIHFTAVPKVKSAAFSFAKKIVAEGAKKKIKIALIASQNAELSRAIAAFHPTFIAVPVGLNDVDARELMLAYAIRPSASGSLGAAVAELREGGMSDAEKIMVVTEKKPGKYEAKVVALKAIKA
ncbi:MAG: pyk [Candidatus Parcubacteria bacterium]|nr:pyk [Candidatus Parcubacteria bacterium]